MFYCLIYLTINLEIWYHLIDTFSGLNFIPHVLQCVKTIELNEFLNNTIISNFYCNVNIMRNVVTFCQIHYKLSVLILKSRHLFTQVYKSSLECSV